MRPPVSLVVPFLGGDREAVRLLSSLRRLRTGAADELVVADNTEDGLMIAIAGTERPVRVVHAHRERSSYHARNAGARASRNPWLLFLDADCQPVPGILDAYFAVPIQHRCGAVAGQIQGDPGQRSRVA